MPLFAILNRKDYLYCNEQFFLTLITRYHARKLDVPLSLKQFQANNYPAIYFENCYSLYFTCVWYKFLTKRSSIQRNVSLLRRRLTSRIWGTVMIHLRKVWKCGISIISVGYRNIFKKCQKREFDMILFWYKHYWYKKLLEAITERWSHQ